MKQIKRTIFLLSVSVLFFSCEGIGQEGEIKGAPEERAVKLTEKMKTRLVLTDAQYNKVYDINLKYARKNTDIMNGDGGKLAKIKSLKSTNEAKSKEMKVVLTQEQFEKYEEMQEELKSEAKKAFKNKTG